MKFFIRQSLHWIILFLLTDAVFLFAAWILRPNAFRYMMLFLFLFTVLSLAAGFFFELLRQKKDSRALEHFLEMPSEQALTDLAAYDKADAPIQTLCEQLLSMQSLIDKKTAGLTEYREYIEAWVHEAKTPLSLSTMILENHKNELPPYIYTRFAYMHHQLYEDVERILYYARLGADHPDIRISRFLLDECTAEALSEYRPFLEERHISVTQTFAHLEVDSDRRIILFLLSQLLGNAVKYADDQEGKIAVTIYREEDHVHLGIYNNGNGVPPEDEPFLFDKGFTGSQPNRQKATGMGLYLVHKYSQKLCIDVRLDDRVPFPDGFGIELIFTR